MNAVAVCIACGCDDLHACDDGSGGACYWVRLDADMGIGVCSQCRRHVPNWDNGVRWFSTDAWKTMRRLEAEDKS